MIFYYFGILMEGSCPLRGQGLKLFERATFNEFVEDIALSSINWPGATGLCDCLRNPRESGS
jgi:hypothetical protein